MPLNLKPAVKPSSKSKLATKKGFARWAKSPAGKHYAMIRKDPAKYAAHLAKSMKKVMGWIATLKKSNDPKKAQKMANHQKRLTSLKKSIAELKKK